MKHRFDDDIVCPYCNAVQMNHEPEAESSISECNCEHCGRRFRLAVEVIHSYMVVGIDGQI